MPQPLNMSGANRRPTTAGTWSASMMPAARQWPTLDVAARTGACRDPSPARRTRSSSSHQSRLKRALQLGGGPNQARASAACAGHPAQHAHQLLRRVPVALQLARRNRRRHRPTVFVDDRVAAVLPPLVLGALRSIVFGIRDSRRGRDRRGRAPSRESAAPCPSASTARSSPVHA